MIKNKFIHLGIIFTFVFLYFFVSIISLIHVVSFFELSNSRAMAIALSIAFELGAGASLASIIIMDKMNKGIVWGLFITLTLMQAMGNTYYSFVNLAEFQGWSELFNISGESIEFQKRILSLLSGAILPIVALGFIKSLVDYIKPGNEEKKVKDEIDDFLELDINQPSINKMDGDLGNKPKQVVENVLSNKDIIKTKKVDVPLNFDKLKDKVKQKFTIFNSENKLNTKEEEINKSKEFYTENRKS